MQDREGDGGGLDHTGRWTWGKGFKMKEGRDYCHGLASEHKGDPELQDLRNKFVGEVRENTEDLNKKNLS